MQVSIATEISDLTPSTVAHTLYTLEYQLQNAFSYKPFNITNAWASRSGDGKFHLSVTAESATATPLSPPEPEVHADPIIDDEVPF